ncbi:Uroporphyrinogen-III synthase [Psychrobacter pasteurii]|uniref:Uroporphyrinogen-III synthase n=1 Tax=Psychrobacter pasteurii TaxID=1945520 RepID=A0A1R4EF35_9GAMM|nr:uroporphyrinogen-III synthase [Psychrobacter pasteurii]SJM37115.1 Uroporphyrinogen-III synthase [Psychrobacter pasteurii]
MIFINTRPTSRALPLTQAMQDKGMTVLEMPLLELAPIDISEREQQYQQDFCQQQDRYQALVVVSPTAARMGLAACPKGFIPSCAVIAVGHATANILREEGWQVQCPEEYSNEGMIKMSSLNSLRSGDHILVWRGRGGRRVLVNFLQDNGVEVHAIAWYQRQCPLDAPSKFKQLHQQLATLNSKERPIALVSSGEAFTNWRLLFAELADEADHPLQLDDFNYLTFGKRLTDTLEELQLKCIRIDNLDVEEVWRGIELTVNGP